MLLCYLESIIAAITHFQDLSCDQILQAHCIFFYAGLTRQSGAATAKMGILKKKTLEVQSKESQKNGNGDSEEPEEESEEDCEAEPEEDQEMEFEESAEEQTEDELEECSDVESEDDPEEDPEEEPGEDPDTELEENPEEQTEEELVEGSEIELEDDQEEDSSEEQAENLAVECATPSKSCNEIVFAKQLIEHEGKDPSAKCLFKPNPDSEIKLANQNSSCGKERMAVNATVKPSLPQKYSLENNCEYDKAVKQVDTSQQSVPGGLQAVVCDTSSGQQANSGKRRRSRWDQDREDDKKTVVEDRQVKKRKTRWDADDSKLRSQEPQVDLEVQALKSRFSELSCILHPREDTNVGQEFRRKLIKEHKKIFSMLEERNAIFCKRTICTS